MRSRRLWSIIFLLILLAVLLLAAGIARAPEASGVEVGDCLRTGEECLRFPSVTGSNLLGEPFTLPDDFGGSLTLVVMPFDEAQQVRAAAWLPLAQELAERHAGFRYYDLPTLTAVNPLVRTMVAGGMSMLIPDEALRRVTVLLFLDDLDTFLAALDIPDRADMQILLLNAEAEVVWRTRGDHNDAAEAALRDAVSAFAPAPR